MARQTEFGTRRPAPLPAPVHFPVADPAPLRPPFRQRLAVGLVPTVILALGAAVVASAQSASPFASQRATQAWETPQADAPVPTTQPLQSLPASPQPYPAPRGLVPPQTHAAPRANPPAAAPDWSVYETPPQAAPSQNWGQAAAQSGPQPSAQYGQMQRRSVTGQPSAQAPLQSAPYGQPAYGNPAYGNPSSPYGRAAQSAPPSGPTSYPAPAPRRSWKDRLGLGSLSTLFQGGLRAGVAARDETDWEEAFVADGDIEAEISAITQGGLEYGLHGQVRAQYDEGRRGFTRRLPDCPPTLAGCPSILVAGTPTALRGHTSQFYSFGPDVADDTQVALESAHLFLRSAYGDVTIGRDDGSAFLFSLGAPTLLNVGASNSPVDYTGLDAVRTVNEASGFAEKITYTSPRLLGDRIGVGVQFGASYAPDAKACGVDYCVEPDGIAGVIAPDIEDVIEAGLALDRTFDNGLSVEGTFTYARGSESSGLAGLDDLESFGAGLEVSLSDWTLGGSWLNSNQGLLAGDYEAYDVGLTWQPSRLGVTLGYGYATDDLVGLTSNQLIGGLTWDWNDSVRLGAGVHYTDRESLRDVGGTAQIGSEDATALFIEGGITF